MPGDFLEKRSDEDRPEVFVIFCHDCGKELISYREGAPVSIRCHDCFVKACRKKDGQ